MFGTVRLRILFCAISIVFLAGVTNQATAAITAFKQAVAEAAGQDDALSTFYRENKYHPIWVGADADDRARRAALLNAAEKAALHGLPASRYRVSALRNLMASAQTQRDRGRVEVELSRIFLQLARDMDSGILTPSRVVSGIKRDVAIRDRLKMLRAFETAEPQRFFTDLVPQSVEYGRLTREKLQLEAAIASGGWGQTLGDQKIAPGDTGARVVALRDRLAAMGYLQSSATQTYGAQIADAIEAFQADHGLEIDGVAGGETLTQLNISPAQRLGQVLVAMERERWLSGDLGRRHIWVNLTDFKAKIIEDGEVFFETRSVIGKNVPDRETPEFSDVMDHMVINPSWYVPRSITVKEYLPALRRNPYALGHLEVRDRKGRVINRARGFAQYNARTFPYSLRQPPSQKNALGLVKFMFPNKYNIYLHDTPAKNLFSRDVRAFSHGCIRLNDPQEFAAALLSFQSEDPKGEFQRYLRTGAEKRLNLDDPLPVHLVYRTAIAKVEGGMEYRRDVYGRDAAILAALRDAGVAVPGGAG